jgi:urea transport system substrate-binding protein
MIKQKFLIIIGSIFFISACTSAVSQEEETIKVGILHSLSGTMAISESPLVDATIMAIDEINESGGVLGRRIEPIVVDTQSDPILAAQEAERLIFLEGVDVLFGCWTSDCRRWVRPVVEGQNSLLFYPVQFEGLEESQNIIYLGATPNQQMLPAVQWSYKNLGERFFLVGSDYVYPWAANGVIKDHLEELGGDVVGEMYIPLGSGNVTSIIDEIQATNPDVILNTINGDSNRAFFDALRRSGISPQDIPTISFSLAEVELANISTRDMVGDYAAWSYFQSLDSSTNRGFVDRFKTKYGEDRVTDDPMAAAYSGVFLWANAVKTAGTTETDPVRSHLSDRSYLSPQGWIRVDPDNYHIWKHIRIGEIREDGQFDIVWESNVDMRPEPFPDTRTEAEWLEFLNEVD